MLIQKGETTLTGTTTTVDLDTPVEEGKAFVMSSQSYDRDGSVGMDFVGTTVHLENVVSGNFTRLRFNRGSSGSGNPTIHWQVVSGDELNVQYGSATSSGSQSISTVDTAKAFPILHFSTTGSFNSHGFMTAELTSTSLDLLGNTGTMRWQVVEWDGATVARYAAGTTGSDINISITSVDLGTTFAYVTSRPTSTSNMRDMAISSRFTSATNLRIDRDNNGGSLDVQAYVVTIPESRVISNTSQYTYTGPSEDLDISGAGGVDPDSTFMVSSWYGSFAQSSMRNATRHKIHNSNTLRFQMDDSLTTPISYFAVEIAEPTPQNTGNFLACM